MRERGGKHGIFISLNINFSFLSFYSARRARGRGRARGSMHGFFISININFSFLCFYSARRARPDEDSDEEGLLAKLAYVFMKNNFFLRTTTTSQEASGSWWWRRPWRR